MTNTEYILYKLTREECTVLYGAAKCFCLASRASICKPFKEPGIDSQHGGPVPARQVT
jgi:hypothetical protein